MEEPNLEVRELRRGEALGLLGRRLRLELCGALDERADDVGLAALAQPVANVRVGARPLLLPDHPRVDGLAAGRQLVQDRRVQVTVGGQGQRAWDRSGRHVKRVRRTFPGSLAVQHGALAHAEAMLLVDDADRQAPELDVGLDQRVRPDDHRELAGRELS